MQDRRVILRQAPGETTTGLCLNVPRQWWWWDDQCRIHTEYDTSIDIKQVLIIVGIACLVIFCVSMVVYKCDKTHNTDEWSYGIQKDSVNFIFHSKYCCCCCKTKFVMTKSEIIKQELELRLKRYEEGLAAAADEDLENDPTAGAAAVKEL